MTRPYPHWKVRPHGKLSKIDDGILTVTGPIRMPLGSFPRRMTVVRLRDSRLVVWSAIALDEKEMATLESFGRPAFLVVPNDHHRLDAGAWKERYPQLQVVAPEGSRAKVGKVVPVDTTAPDFGDPDVQKNHMRPVIPALAALAWGEPRRRAYWEQELLNALVIIDRGWSTPEEMRGSWAGAMGHTQWMPEVWLNVGLDYDGDGRVSPFGKPDDGLAGTAQYLVKRGKYRAGEHWGYEVRGVGRASEGASRTYEAWQRAGVTRADAKAFPHPSASAKLWVPVPGGPAFLLGQNFYAVRSYNPSMNYTLSIVHLGDRIVGGGPFVQPFPGGERTPTLAEVQEIQQRLTALGFDTGGTDGRVGNGTMMAVRNFQRKVGMQPADGYAGVKLLARLRQGL